jgi:hypothetical protein
MPGPRSAVARRRAQRSRTDACSRAAYRRRRHTTGEERLLARQAEERRRRLAELAALLASEPFAAGLAAALRRG